MSKLDKINTLQREKKPLKNIRGDLENLKFSKK